MTRFDFCQCPKALYFESSSLDLLVVHSFLEQIPEGVRTYNPYDQRRIFGGEGISRPISKLSEIIKKYGFELVFAGRFGAATFGNSKHRYANSKHHLPNSKETPSSQ